MAGKRDEPVNSDNQKDCHQILEFKSHKQIHHKGNMVFEDDGDGDQEEDDEASDAKGDESDLDLAWKLLVDERSFVEKQPCDTMEKANILSALAKGALEREDLLSPYEDEKPFEESQAPTHVVFLGDDTRGFAADSVPTLMLSYDQTKAGEHSSAQEESNHMIGKETRNPELSSSHALRQHEESGMADSQLRSGERYGQRRDYRAQHETLWHSFEEEQRRRHMMYKPSPPMYHPTLRIMYQVPPVHPQSPVYQPIPAYVPTPAYPY
ncbi:hypothetical protein E3N88_04956 [Mikania micrantha]|uniref:Uncharacterized protein n=1 Tax=Mikania micrantha TaxID=192012 RepID=A0A5N6PY13_9ASTR|nr:hypothetical protein E3N88_04956 [Mikania micrantha]